MIKLQEAVLLTASLCAVGFSYAALRNTAGSRHGNAVLSPNPVRLEQLIPLADTLVAGTSGDVVVQALDYECPPCRGHETENRAFRAKYPKTGWLILQFPLGMHRHAYPLSLAALEADRLGAFKEFHAAVMARPILPQESVGKYLDRVAPSLAWIGAKDLRKDEGFRKRLDTIRHLPIDGTPTYFVFRRDGATGLTNSVRDAEAFLGAAKPTGVSEEGCRPGAECR